ncbi:MAG: hypothetical protein JXA18_09295 [Chitinispirillaceae bacterium]|nr:hypothetical protein [Chitinispirillaceae bacterium]
MMHGSGLSISGKDFTANVVKKLANEEFRNDMTGLLRADIKYDIDVAWDVVSRELVGLLP